MEARESKIIGASMGKRTSGVSFHDKEYTKEGRGKGEANREKSARVKLTLFHVISQSPHSLLP